MDLVRPFYNDAKTQEFYRDRVKIIVEELESIYGKSFKLNVFLPKIQELARCEISIQHYSKQIANQEETGDTKQRLRDERSREQQLWQQLGLSMSLIERSKKDRHTEDAEDFETHMMNLLSGGIDAGDINLDDIRTEYEDDMRAEAKGYNQNNLVTENDIDTDINDTDINDDIEDDIEYDIEDEEEE